MHWIHGAQSWPRNTMINCSRSIAFVISHTTKLIKYEILLFFIPFIYHITFLFRLKENESPYVYKYMPYRLR